MGGRDFRATASLTDDSSDTLERIREGYANLKSELEGIEPAASAASGSLASVEESAGSSAALVEELYQRLQELGTSDDALAQINASFGEFYTEGYTAGEAADALTEAIARLDEEAAQATSELDNAASSLSTLEAEADSAASSVGEVDQALSGLDGQLTSLAQSQAESTTAAEGGRDAYGDIASTATISTARIGAMDKGLIGTVKSFGLVKLTAAGAALALLDVGMGAVEEEADIARLQATIDANIAGHGDYSAALDEATAAAARLGFADDQVRASLMQSIPFTKNFAASVDIMRVAMELAIAKDMDLAQANELLVRNMLSGGTTFRRMGIDIKAGATAIEVLNAVHAKYAGQTTAYGRTVEASFARMKVAAGELADVIGGPLTGSLDFFFKTLASTLTAARYGLVDFSDFASQNLFDPQAMAAQTARYKAHTKEMWDEIHGIWGEGAENIGGIAQGITDNLGANGGEAGDAYTRALAEYMDAGTVDILTAAEAQLAILTAQQDAWLQAGADNGLSGGEGVVTGITDTLPDISTAGDDAVTNFDKTKDAGTAGGNMGTAGGSSMANKLNDYQSSIATASGNLVASADQPKAASAAGANTGGAFGSTMVSYVNDGIKRSNAAIAAANITIGEMGGPLIPLIKPAGGGSGTVAGSAGGGITPQTKSKIVNLAPPPQPGDPSFIGPVNPIPAAILKAAAAVELARQQAAYQAAVAAVAAAARPLLPIGADKINWGDPEAVAKAVKPKGGGAGKGGGGGAGKGGGGGGGAGQGSDRDQATYDKAVSNLADAKADLALLEERIRLEEKLEAAKDGVTESQEALKKVTADFAGQIEDERNKIQDLDRAQKALTIGDEIEAATAELEKMRTATEGLLNPLIVEAHQLGEELEDVEAAAETALAPFIKSANDAQAAADAVSKKIDDLHYGYSQMYQGIDDALYELQQREASELADYDRGIEQKQAGVTALQDKLDAFHTKEEQRSQKKELEGLGQTVTNLQARLLAAREGTDEYKEIQRQLAEAEGAFGSKTEEFSITNELTQKQAALELAQREREERAQAFQEERAILEARRALLEREEELKARPLEAEQRAAQQAVADAQAALTAEQAVWDARSQAISDQITAIEDLRANIAFEASQRERDQGLIIADLQAKKEKSDEYYDNERDRINAHIIQLGKDQEAAEANAGVAVTAARVTAEAAAEAIRVFAGDNRLGDAAQKVIDATQALDLAGIAMGGLETKSGDAGRALEDVKPKVDNLAGATKNGLAPGLLDAKNATTGFIDNALTPLKNQLDPLVVNSLGALINTLWDPENPLGWKKRYNTSLHEMGVASGLFIDELDPKFTAKLPEWTGLFDGWGEAIGRVNDQLDELADKDVPVGSEFPGRAAGGPVTAGTPYMVGERGPEMFVPYASGSILPTGTMPYTPQSTGGGGPMEVNMTFNIQGGELAKHGDKPWFWEPYARGMSIALESEIRKPR